MIREKMAFNTVIVGVFILKIVNCYPITLEVQMVDDLLNANNMTSVVVAAVCWKLRDKKEMIKTMNNRVISIMDVTERPLSVSLSDHQTVFVLDSRCDGSEGFLLAAGQLHLFNSPYRWIIIAQTILKSSHDGLMNDLNSPSDFDSTIFEAINPLVDSNVLTATTKANNVYDIQQVYRRCRDCDLIWEPYALWSHADGIQDTRTSSSYLAISRQNLMGTLIRVSYVITDNDTVNHLSDYRDKHIDTITKVNYVLTNHLIDFLNASRSFNFVDSWGYLDKGNGSWSGMIGELTRNSSDVGGSPLFFTADRIAVIDYIAMSTPTRSKFVFRQPKLSYVSNVFVLPFRTTVWISSLCLLSLLAIILYIASYWEWLPYKIDEKGRSNAGILRASWSDVVTLTFGAVCQQGSSVELKGPMGRLTMLLLFLSVMFLYTSYSANIVALLQSSSSRIHSLADLLNSRLKFGVHDTVFNHYYFSTATEAVRRAIYQKKVAPPGEHPHFMTLEEGVKHLREGLFAFHMEIGVGYKVVSELFHEDEKCGLQEIQYLQVVEPWLAVQKNTSFKEIFKIGMRRIQEFGLQNRENWRLYTKKPHCSGHGSNFVSVGMVDCYPAITILAYGIMSAIVILLFEIVLQKIRTRQLGNKMKEQKNDEVYDEMKNSSNPLFIH